MKQKISAFIQGSPLQFPLNSRLLNTASSLLFFMQLGFVIMTAALDISQTHILATAILLTVMYGTIFYYNRFVAQKNATTYLFIVTSIASGCIFWLMADGWRGSIPIAVPTCAIVFLPLLDKWAKTITLAAVGCLLFAMTALQVNYPELISPYPSETMHLVDVLSTVMISSIVCIFMVEHLRRAYQEEKEKAQEQMAMLRQSQTILEHQKDNAEQVNAYLKKTLSELRNKEEQLVQAEKMASLGLMTAGISHEISNPVNYIQTGSTFLIESLNPVFDLYAHCMCLRQDPSEENLQKLLAFMKQGQWDKPEVFKEEMTEMIEGIAIGSGRITELVKGLRSFSRVDKGVFEYIDIHQLLDASLVLLSPKYKHRVQIVKEYDYDVESVQCLGGKIQQVFINLLSNAVDAIAEEGTITISTKRVENWAAIRIADTGSGISEAVQKQIFDPFFTTKPFGKGTGLGLAIVYNIVLQHNGMIDLYSEEGKGTAFTVTLPLKHVPQAEATIPESE